MKIGIYYRIADPVMSLLQSQKYGINCNNVNHRIDK